MLTITQQRDYRSALSQHLLFVYCYTCSTTDLLLLKNHLSFFVVHITCP